MTTRTELVRGLAKPGEAILLSLDAHKCHMLHMAVGLAGEAGELAEAKSRENTLEELGDGFFYLEGLLQGTGRTVEELKPVTPYAFVDHRDLLLAVTVESANILDDVKRYVIYNKSLDEKSLNKHVDTLLGLLYGVAAVYGFSDEEIHADNLRKLGSRYKSLQYSDSAAQARADKQ